jgi:hypothetical protein
VFSVGETNFTSNLVVQSCSRLKTQHERKYTSAFQNIKTELNLSTPTITKARA